MAHEYDLRRGGLYMVASALLFALMSVAVKMASATLPNVVVVFFRSGFGLLTLLPFIIGVDLRTTQVREHLIRSLAGIASMYCFFYTIAHMRLADAVLLNYSLPLFMPFVESAWLGEEFPRRLWIPVVRRLPGRDRHPAAGQRADGAGGPPGRGLGALRGRGPGRRAAPDPHRAGAAHRLLLRDHRHVPLRAARGRVLAHAAGPGVGGRVAMGLTATLGQLAMTRAYAHAPAAQVGPFIYSSVVFAAVLDWLFWRTLPDAFTLAGAALVVAAGILSLRLNPAEAEVETPRPRRSEASLRRVFEETNGAPARRFSVRSARGPPRTPPRGRPAAAPPRATIASSSRSSISAESSIMRARADGRAAAAQLVGDLRRTPRGRPRARRCAGR